MATKKYIYAFSSNGFDDSNIHIYRQDESGTVLYAKLGDDHYHYADLAELPRRVIETFNTVSQKQWGEATKVENQLPVWAIAENNNDTGITFEEFVNIVLEKIPNSYYNNSTSQFYVTQLTPSGKKEIRIPSKTLKHLAQYNKYFESAYWMA